MKRSAALVLSLVSLATAHLGGAEKEWTVFENCKLVPNPANDGDSFHASCGEKEYVFRLYLVDTPEIEGTEPSRLIQQAKHFEISVPQAIEVGEAAKEFTQQKLSTPFTVFTRMAAGMGRSNIPRIYVFVQTKDGDLGEQLVRHGLARVYGTKVVPPGLESSEVELVKLNELEAAAEEEKIGGWGATSGGLRKAPAREPTYTVFSKSREVAKSHAPEPGETSPHETAPKEQPTAKLDINTATKEQLDALPGVGPTTADAIIAGRPYSTPDDLRHAKGIGPKRYEKLRPYFQP